MYLRVVPKISSTKKMFFVEKRCFEILSGLGLEVLLNTRSHIHNLTTQLLWMGSINYECHQSAFSYLEAHNLRFVTEQSLSCRTCFYKNWLVDFELSSWPSHAFLLLSCSPGGNVSPEGWNSFVDRRQK